MQRALLGREAELSELRDLIAGGPRVLTLLGPGGVGKTRLARACAEDLADTSFCELEAQRGPEEVAGALARSLGMVLRSPDPVKELGGLLQTKGRAVVFLDNLEQLQAQAILALEGWLERAPELRLVLTSQRRLGLREEHVFPVEPLSEAAGCALFMERALAVGVRLGADEVRPLVQALDRLPLALELAAARCRIMAPAQILERLSERFKLLAGRRHGPARHASLQAALGWTWELLTPLQQQALAQLSLFRSTFQLQDAERILSLPSGHYAPNVVEELVDFSLVQPGPALRIFTSVRDFALGKLEDPEGAHGRHADWLASWAYPEHPEQRLNGRRAKSVELMPDAEAALAWCLERGDPRAGECALVVSAIREEAGPQQGVGASLKRCLELEGIRPWTRMRLWVDYAHTHRYAARLEPFGEALREAQAIAETLGASEMASVVQSLALHSWYSGDLETAKVRSEEALALIPDGPEFDTQRGRVLGLLANMCNQLGDVPRARATYQRALKGEIDHSERAVLFGNFGLLELEDGQLGPAEVYLGSSIQSAQELGFKSLESVMLGNLALVRSLQGRHAEACTLLNQAVEMSIAIGDVRSLRYQRASLAEILLVLGELAAAGQHLVFLAQEPERDSGIGVLVRALRVEWLARSGSKAEAQGELPELLDAVAGLSLPQLQGELCAHLSRLCRDGFLQGDAPGLLSRAKEAAERLDARPNSSLAQAIARAEPKGQPSVDLSTFEGRDGPVDLRRRPLLRRLLAPLVSGASVPTAELLAAGWPDSKLAPDRLAPRLYSALHELRRLGIHVENEEGLYRLSP